MRSGKLFDEKRKYVESLNFMLRVLDDFDYVKYARSYVTEQEYVKVADKLGGCAFLDVTAMDDACILKEIALIILDKVPKSCITNRETIRKVAQLFR